MIYVDDIQAGTSERILNYCCCHCWLHRIFESTFIKVISNSDTYSTTVQDSMPSVTLSSMEDFKLHIESSRAYSNLINFKQNFQIYI